MLFVAWRMTSTQGFHAIMNLFLVPLWFLSGALFPEQGAWRGLKWIMAVNPRARVETVKDSVLPDDEIASNLDA